MAGFTKLFSSILHSTIWQETNETRIVWLTMLAMSDKNGCVNASVPGLAHAARVTVPECETALGVLLAPDDYSRTPDHEGRRIEAIDGGWMLLNHGKYRAKMNEEERREYNRVKQAESRAKKKNADMSMTVNDSQQCKHIQKQKQSSEASLTLSNGEADAPPCPQADVVEAIWKAYPKKGRERSTRAKAKKAWSSVPSKNRPELKTVLSALSSWKACDEWQRDFGSYVPGVHIWIKNEAFADPPTRIERGAKKPINPERPWEH